MERQCKEKKLYDLNDLASAYMNRGNAYRNSGKYIEAMCDYVLSIRIREKLRDGGKLYEIGDLAGDMLNMGILLYCGFANVQGALEILNQGIAMLESEPELSYLADGVLKKCVRSKK